MLQLNHISKTFSPGTVNEKKALTDISLHLDAGDFVTVLGSNGAGKSTLFSVISGAEKPDCGQIFLDGQDVTGLPDYKRSRFIGRLFQDPMKGTAPHMTVEENLTLAYLRATGRKSPFSMISRADRQQFREKLAQLNMGLEDRMDQSVGLLSGGQRQALTLLMATLVPPKLLLLDEHTAALDPAASESILELTRKIVAENHLTCMMITHSIPAALALGNRTIILDAGRIRLELDGESRSALSADDLLKLFRGSDTDVFSAAEKIEKTP